MPGTQRAGSLSLPYPAPETTPALHGHGLRGLGNGYPLLLMLRDKLPGINQSLLFYLSFLKLKAFQPTQSSKIVTSDSASAIVVCGEAEPWRLPAPSSPLMSLLYKELKSTSIAQSINYKTNTPLKNWAKGLYRHFSEEMYRWLINP